MLVCLLMRCHTRALCQQGNIGHFKAMNPCSVELGLSYLVLVVVVTFPDHHQPSLLTWVALGNQAFLGLEVIQLWKENSWTVRAKLQLSECAQSPKSPVCSKKPSANPSSN